MKRNITILFFFLVTAVLLFVYLSREIFVRDDQDVVRAKTVIPVTNSEEQLISSSLDSSAEEISFTSLITLLVDEILINTVSFDFNSDTYEDQIIAVKKANNPNIVIIVGLYNHITMNYERMFQYQTKISQSKTFSLSTLDLSGLNINNLIYTGFTDQNESVLEAFALEKNPTGYELKQIVSLYSEGTILIQQPQLKKEVFTDEALQLTYPIMVYSTEIKNDTETFDQLQTVYLWDDLSGMYLKGTQTRVPGKKIEAKELAKIQDGTTDSFANFLNGLWYLSAQDGTSSQYLFFNYEAKEIIFSQENTQEIYSWVNSTLRRNGIYLSTVNTSISNLTRYFDISLLSLDEIKVKINDDVGMVINSDTLWDGIYKKVQNTIDTTPSQSTQSSYKNISILENAKSWSVMEGNTISFKEGKYSFSSGSVTETGIYSQKVINNIPLLQMRADSSTALFGGFYRIETEEKAIYLEPVRTTVSGIISSAGDKIKLEQLQ